MHKAGRPADRLWCLVCLRVPRPAIASPLCCQNATICDVAVLWQNTAHRQSSITGRAPTWIPWLLNMPDSEDPSLGMPDLGGLPALPDTAAADASTLGITPLLMATGCEEDGKGDLFSCCTLQTKHFGLSEAVQHIQQCTNGHAACTDAVVLTLIDCKWHECTRKRKSPRC